MNLNNMEIKKALGDEDLKYMEDALRSDEIIVPAILKLLRYRLRGCKTTRTMLERASYPYERAAKDGREMELDWLIEKLQEN